MTPKTFRFAGSETRYDPGHLLRGSTLAELLETTQLDDLEVGVLDVPVVVQEDIDLGVPLESRHGRDRYLLFRCLVLLIPYDRHS
jgi:hypothetical protein